MSRCLRQSPWQVRDKPVCVSLMEFSPSQCTGKVNDKVRNKVWDKFSTKSRTCLGHRSWKSATWFVLQTFMICVRDKSMTLSGTCPGLCHKVGIMEFGLKTQSSDWHQTDKHMLAAVGTFKEAFNSAHLFHHLCKLGVLRKKLVDSWAGHTSASGDPSHSTRLTRKQLGSFVTVQLWTTAAATSTTYRSTVTVKLTRANFCRFKLDIYSRIYNMSIWAS